MVRARDCRRDCQAVDAHTAVADPVSDMQKRDVWKSMNIF